MYAILRLRSLNAGPLLSGLMLGFGLAVVLGFVVEHYWGGTDDMFTTAMRAGAFGSPFSFGVAVIVWSIAEELAFRYLGFRILRSEGLNDFQCLAVTSVLFALLHLPTGVHAGLAALFGGAILGWLYAFTTHGLARCIGMHLGVNLTAFALIVTMADKEHLVVSMFPGWALALAPVCFAVGAVSCWRSRMVRA